MLDYSVFKKKIVSVNANIVAFIDQVICNGSKFLVTVVLARYLGASDFSNYIFLWTFCLFFIGAGFSLITLPMMTDRIQQNNKSEYDSIIQSGIIIFSIISFLLMIIISMVIKIIYKELSLSALEVTSIAICSSSFVLYEHQRRWFFSLGLQLKALSFDFLTNSMILFFLLLIVFTELHTISSIMILMSLVYISMYILAIKRSSIKITFHNFHMIKKTLNTSQWLFYGSLFQWLGGQVLIFAAAYFFTINEVGEIGVARTLVAPTLLFFMSLENIMNRMGALNYRDHGVDGLIEYLKITAVWSSAITFVICMIIYMVSNWLTLTIYGEEYSGAVIYVKWFCLIHFTMFLSRPLGVLVRCIGKTKILFWSSFISVFISIIVALIAPRLFGKEGLMLILQAKELAIILIIFALYKTGVSNNELKSNK